MTDEVTILSMPDMQKLVDDIESTQKVMEAAISEWQQACKLAMALGLDLDHGEVTIADRTWVFPIKKITYEPAIEFNIP